MGYSKLRIDNGELCRGELCSPAIRTENGELRIHKEFVILSEAKNPSFDLEVGEVCE
ncbi:hypothetical protein SAMN05660462_00827 [Proteiniborus ethanoligenes]|uniref:Uncharacterized protein n=1 Tax=Proteiniborus ethanoligenes TaxID=415015 RepID=A0A1H3MIB0_9FIRM|nr:hypothetical protein [Proteiniborus ethanoligenes]SDY76432.1 hypothetical protein SAMN05660462_00827 [Proteiniborus ethanoligenes]